MEVQLYFATVVSIILFHQSKSWELISLNNVVIDYGEMFNGKVKNIFKIVKNK